MPSASRHRLLLFVVAVAVAPALSRWCSPDEFRDSDGLIRLELLPEHCDWLGLGGQRLTPANLRNFSTALARHPNLVHLGLGGNEISDAGAVELARGLSVDMELEWLSLHSNLIGDRGAVALAESLSDHPALEMLSLWDNDIGDEGVIALARSVQTNQIRELSLAQNPRITDRGVIFLAKTLKDSKGNLTTLWLHGLPLVSETGRRELAATLRGDASHIFTLMDDHAPDDGHPLCNQWAREGECERNPGYMNDNCASSCDGSSRRRFTDAHPECPAWAMQDHGCAPIAETCVLSCGKKAQGFNTHPHSGHHEHEL